MITGERMNTIKTFSYNGHTLDLFIDVSNPSMDYAITIFCKDTGTTYLHNGINDIYKAVNLFDRYKIDLLRENEIGGI